MSREKHEDEFGFYIAWRQKENEVWHFLKRNHCCCQPHSIVYNLQSTVSRLDSTISSLQSRWCCFGCSHYGNIKRNFTITSSFGSFIALLERSKCHRLLGTATKDLCSSHIILCHVFWDILAVLSNKWQTNRILYYYHNTGPRTRREKFKWTCLIYLFQ